MRTKLNKRQIKKDSNTAKNLLMLISPKEYPENLFIKNDDSEWDECPKGTWEIWFRTSYEYDEWDSETAFDVLCEHLFNEFAQEEFDDEKFILVCVYRPDLSTAKKVFDLAKKLIKTKSVGGGV